MSCVTLLLQGSHSKHSIQYSRWQQNRPWGGDMPWYSILSSEWFGWYGGVVVCAHLGWLFQKRLVNNKWTRKSDLWFPGLKIWPSATDVFNTMWRDSTIIYRYLFMTVRTFSQQLSHLNVFILFSHMDYTLSLINIGRAGSLPPREAPDDPTAP